MITILVLLTISILIFAIISLINYCCKNYLNKNSLSIKNLKELNGKYKFYTFESQMTFSHTYDNEFFYNNISCEDYLIYQLQFEKNNVLKHIDYAISNKKLYNSYLEDISKIQNFGKYKNTSKIFIKHLLIKIEKRMFKKYMIQP